jgi:hypothetical protein
MHRPWLLPFWGSEVHYAASSSLLIFWDPQLTSDHLTGYGHSLAGSPFGAFAQIMLQSMHISPHQECRTRVNTKSILSAQCITSSETWILEVTPQPVYYQDDCDTHDVMEYM